MSNEENPIKQLVVDYLSSRSNVIVKMSSSRCLRVSRVIYYSRGGVLSTSDAYVGDVFFDGSLVRVSPDNEPTVEFDMVSPKSLKPLMRRLRRM